MRMIKLKPISFQTIMMTMATRARSALERNAIRGSPALVMMLLIRPSCTWYISAQITDTTTMDDTTGAKMADRTIAANRFSRARNRARPMLSAIWAGTFMTTYAAVTWSDFQKMGSPSIRP